MKRLDDTQTLATTSSDPRIHLLDDTWLLTIFAVLLATAIPWLVSGFDINFVAISLGLLALGAIHTAFTIIGKPARMVERRPVLGVLHTAGLLIVGLIWLHAGGLQNPAFLIVFILPIIGAIFLSRWQPYLTALLAIVAAGAVAIAQAPELRWYAPGLNTAGAWLANLFGQDGAGINAPFPGFYAPSAFYLVLLEVFAVLAIACAVAAEYLGTVFERLYTQVAIARSEAERSQELWSGLIEELPLPAFLVDADTFDVLCASESAAVLTREAGNGRSLFEIIEFTYPDVIQDLITGVGGTVPLCMVRTRDDDIRVTEVHVQHAAQKGRRFALLIIRDTTDEHHVQAALDATEQAALVFDGRGLVRTYNRPAGMLFPGIQRRTHAGQLLSLSATPTRWWDPGLKGRRKMHLEIAGRVYQVTSAALPLPGEEESVYIVTFLPVARAALGDQTSIIPTSSNTDATGLGPSPVSKRTSSA